MNYFSKSESRPYIAEKYNDRSGKLKLMLLIELSCIELLIGPSCRQKEKNIANLAGYFDSLRNMKVLYLDKNMQLCDKD